MSYSSIVKKLKNLSLFKKFVCALVSIALVFGLVPSLKLIVPAYADDSSAQTTEATEVAKQNEQADNGDAGDNESQPSEQAEEASPSEQSGTAEQQSTEATSKKTKTKCHNCTAEGPNEEFNELVKSLNIPETDREITGPVGEASAKYGQNIKFRIEILSALTGVESKTLDSAFDKWVQEDTFLNYDMGMYFIEYFKPLVEAGTVSMADAALCVLISWIALDMDMFDSTSSLVSSNKEADVVKCFLNSDVIFKAKAKMIEALQTAQLDTICYTIMSLYSSVVAEANKCLAYKDANETGGRKFSTIIPVLRDNPDTLFDMGKYLLKYIESEELYGNYDFVQNLTYEWADKIGNDINKGFQEVYNLTMQYESSPTDENYSILMLSTVLWASNMMLDMPVSFNISSGGIDIEVVKCILNSDVIFKPIAKIIEAVQTKEVTTIIYTLMQVYPSYVDEMKRCLSQGSDNPFSNLKEAFLTRYSEGKYVLCSTGNYFSNLDRAFNNSPHYSSYQFTDNRTMYESASLTYDKVTVDLSGYCIKGDTDTTMLKLFDHSTVTIVDNSSDKTGKMIVGEDGKLVELLDESALSIVSGTFNCDVSKYVAVGSTIVKNEDETWTVKTSVKDPVVVNDNLIYNGEYQLCIKAGSGYMLGSNDSSVLIDNEGNALIKDLKAFNGEEREKYHIVASLQNGYCWEDGTNGVKDYYISMNTASTVEVPIEAENCTVEPSTLFVNEEASSITRSFDKCNPSIMKITYTNEFNKVVSVNYTVTPNEGYTFAYWDIVDADGNNVREKQGLSDATTTDKPSKIIATSLDSADGVYGDMWTSKINYFAAANEASPLSYEQMLTNWIKDIKNQGLDSKTSKDYLDYLNAKKSASTLTDVDKLMAGIIFASFVELDVMKGYNNASEYPSSWLSSLFTQSAFITFLTNVSQDYLSSDKDTIFNSMIESYTALVNIYPSEYAGRNLSELLDELATKPSKSSVSIQNFVNQIIKSADSSFDNYELVDSVYGEFSTEASGGISSMYNYITSQFSNLSSSTEAEDAYRVSITALLAVSMFIFMLPLSYGDCYTCQAKYFIALSDSSMSKFSATLLNIALSAVKSKDPSMFKNYNVTMSLYYAPFISKVNAFCNNENAIHFANLVSVVEFYNNPNEDNIVFQNGENFYCSLTNAFGNAKNGDTIKLLKDFKQTYKSSITNKYATLDLNGHKLTSEFDPAVVNSDEVEDYMIELKKKSYLNIVDTSDGIAGELSCTGNGECLTCSDASTIRFISGNTSQDVKTAGYVYDWSTVTKESADLYKVGTVAKMPTVPTSKVVYNGQKQYVLYDSVGCTFESDIEGSEYDSEGNLILKDVPTESVNNDNTYSVNVTIDPGYSAPEGFEGLAYFSFYPADLTYKSGSAENVYDGNPLTSSEYEITKGKLAGEETLTVSMTGAQTEVGESENKFTVTDGTGKLSNYNVTTECGTLKVTPCPLTYKSGSAENVYDGNPLTSSEYEITKGKLVGEETLTVTMTGAQTEVGESENKFTVTDGTGKLSNYNVTTEYGILKVTPCPLTYKSGSAEKVYDGTPLTNNECELIEGELVGEETLTVELTGTQTEVGESENTFTVTDGSGKVSNYNVTSEYGTLKVTAQTPVPGGDDVNPATSGTSTGDNTIVLMAAFMLALLGCSIIIVRSRRMREIK